MSSILFSLLWLWFLFICVSDIWGLNILFCLISFAFVNMSLSCQMLLSLHSLWYCSVIIGIFLMCLVLHVITLPVFITLTLYDFLLCSVLLIFTVNLCIHDPPLSLYMSTVDAKVKETRSLWVSLFFKYLYCHNLRVSEFSSSTLQLMGYIFILATKLWLAYWRSVLLD